MAEQTRQVSVALPDQLTERIDKLADRWMTNRSSILRRAADEFLREHDAAGVTDRQPVTVRGAY